ncbi:ShlB/FhaC/HecB family hemolysin secretion/activation protein [Sphingomonas xanthus]|uniref:ShlB/FhaC/HecB family hemolysin secretion/activation protein n=1 Tax=Sphingomonas xanthus TaxID=2594473 RepID=A0A516INK5_9SPHN|nr:POTRA domain-containing protein [Sphingomonas xanthus]QDP18490.1 ShlB/FhaC/HecB family hemolysin secretion/activation protein [Sphingomonas xanthus]
MSRVEIHHLWAKIAVLLGGTLLAGQAQAQADPASIERTIPVLSDEKREAGPAQSRAVNMSRTSSVGISETFVLSAVNITGATQFEPRRLASAFEPKLATTVGPEELAQIADAITAIYHEAGYHLSYAVIPQQSVQSGILTIRVVESYVADVTVEAPAPSKAAVLRLVERLKSERPLKTATLNRVLGLVRDIPGITIEDVQVARFLEDPARQRLTIKAAGQRYSGFLFGDNRGTIPGARARLYSSGVANSLLTPGDQFQVDVFGIPSDRFQFGYAQLKASIPVGWNGVRVGGRASASRQRQELDGPDQLGRSRQIRADLSYALRTTNKETLIASLALTDGFSREHRDGVTNIRDRVQTMRTGLEYIRRGPVYFLARLDLVKGLDLGDATTNGDPLASRPGAGARFAKALLDMQLVTAISPKITTRLELSGQLATAPLLAAEEFALGGGRIGRAFDYNVASGDHGVGAMWEVAYRLAGVPSPFSNVDLFGYLEAGVTDRIRERHEVAPDGAITGAGVGTRFKLLNMMVSAEAGIPIASSREQKGPRAFISLSRIF